MIVTFILLGATVALDILGQVFFKLGVGHNDGVQEHAEHRRGVARFLRSLLSSKWIAAGVVVYTAEFIVWFAALSRAPLSVAFPFNALAYCGVVLASRYVLHETVSVRRWLGTLAIAAGVLLVCWP
jgi:drug/metabolite transporter (DMT)-like permease